VVRRTRGEAVERLLAVCAVGRMLRVRLVHPPTT
jgi:hypothetical protein